MEKTCTFCDEPILETDLAAQGLNFTAHVECEFRQVAGSVGHQMKRCTCYGGTEEDPVGMTPREAARAAYDLFREHTDLRVKPTLYYDRQGNPIADTFVWAQMFENEELRRVRDTHLPNGFRVSTVWLGLNHNPFSDGPPLIFESMVFRSSSSRWSSAIAARSVVKTTIRFVTPPRRQPCVDMKRSFIAG